MFFRCSFSHFQSNSLISSCRTKTSNSTWTTVGTSWACTMWRWGEPIIATCLLLLCAFQSCNVKWPLEPKPHVSLSHLSLCGWFVNLTKGKDYSHLNSSSRAYRSRFSSSRYYEACHIVTRGKFSTGTWNPRTSSSTSEENSNWLISVRGAGLEFSVQGRIKDKERFLLWMWGEKKNQ